MTTSRSYRYYEFVMAAFVTVLICSNLIGPAKIAQFDLPWLGVLTPVTYRLVNFLKRAEDEDYYDRNTNFNPFALKP